MSGARRYRATRFGGSLLRNRSGVTAVEFALSAPLIVLAFGAALELMRFASAGAALTAAVGETARIAARSPVGTTGAREALIRRGVTLGVCPRALGEPGGCMWDEGGAPLTITSTTLASSANDGQPEPFVDQPPLNGVYDAGEPFSDFNGNGVRDANMGLGDGGPGDIVLYEVAVRQRVYHPMIAVAQGSVYTHRARMVLRNAPK